MNAPSDLGSDAPANGSDFPFQIANTGLIGILLNDGLDCILVKSALFREQTVLLDLPRHKVSLSNVQLFHFGIAGHSNSLHSIAERWWDAFPIVGRTDKNNMTEVERNIQIAVHEIVVLPRIKYLKQSAGRITTDICSDLVDFIQHHHRVAESGSANLLDDPTRHRSDISSPVPPDFSFVANASQGDAREFSAQRIRDRLTQTRLPDSGRSEKAKDRTSAPWI